MTVVRDSRITNPVSERTQEERKAALSNLVTSEGWEIFTEAMEAEWGDTAILDRLTLALGKIQNATGADEQREFTKLINARAQMRAMLGWPRKELKKFKGDDQGTRPSVIRRS